MTHLTNEASAREHLALARKLKRVEREAREEAIRNRDRIAGLQLEPTASVEDDAEEREPGDTNWSGYGFDVHPQVTLVSVAILVIFILATLMFKEDASHFFKATLALVTAKAGWFLILVTNIFILAALYFGLGKFGRIRIGGKDARP